MSMIKIWNGSAWINVGIKGEKGDPGDQGIQGEPGRTSLLNTNVLYNGKLNNPVFPDYYDYNGMWFAVSGVLNMQATVQGGYVTLRTDETLAGEIYYVHAWVSALSDDFGMRVDNQDTTPVELFYDTGGAVEQCLYTNINASQFDGDRLFISFFDDSVSGWDEAYALNAVVLNLTKIYGSGNEPSAADMYAKLMAEHLDNNGLAYIDRPLDSGTPLEGLPPCTNIENSSALVDSLVNLDNRGKIVDTGESSNVFTILVDNVIKNTKIDISDNNAKTISLDIEDFITADVELFLRIKFTSYAPAITWFSGITWLEGSAPTFEADKTYRISMWSENAGTNWHAVCNGGW